MAVYCNMRSNSVPTGKLCGQGLGEGVFAAIVCGRMLPLLQCAAASEAGQVWVIVSLSGFFHHSVLGREQSGWGWGTTGSAETLEE